jgi:hypothetical protein
LTITICFASSNCTDKAPPSIALQKLVCISAYRLDAKRSDRSKVKNFISYLSLSQIVVLVAAEKIGEWIKK